MSLKSIFENIKQPFSIDAKMEKYEDILRKSIDGAFELKGSVVKHTLPNIFISFKPGADLKMVKEIYARFGIKLSQRLMKNGIKFTPVLCITMLDFNKLNEKQRDFFNRTTNADRIKC